MCALPRFDIVSCGLNVVDNMVVLPEKVRKNEKHAVAQQIMQGGGPGANQACGLAALGWRVGFVARHGDNPVSRFAESEFTRYGVSLDLIIPDPAARPAVAVVEVDLYTGERTVFYNQDHYAPLKADDISDDVVRVAKLVIADAYEREAALRLLQIAREVGIPGVLDIEGGDPVQLRPLCAAATHLILSREGSRQITGDSDLARVFETLTNWTDAQLIVTDGVHGSWALTPDGIVHQPAFSAETVDTTGCGDSFHAAYASALLDGFPLASRLEFAAWIAAQVTKALGGRANLPTREWVRNADQSTLSPELRMALTPASL